MQYKIYTVGDGIEEKEVLGVSLSVMSDDGTERIDLNDNNCTMFEKHPFFYKIIYKPFKERFIHNQMLAFGEPEILEQVLKNE